MSTGNILANLTFCIPLGLIMLILFIYFRTTLPLFYNRNILFKGRPVLGAQMFDGFLLWLKGIIGIDDKTVLRTSGLDVLITVNVFRLFLLIVSVMSVPCLLILVPYYYANSDYSGGITFDTLTISDLNTDSFWPPLIILFLLTALVIYGIYIFYDNLIRLRQAYLLRPSSFNNLGESLTNTESFGSIKPARRRFDQPTCTVLLRYIPPELSSPEKLRDSLEKSGIRDIKHVQFIGDFSKLNQALSKRNSAVFKLEEALKIVNDQLKKSSSSESESKFNEEITSPQSPKESPQLTLKERINLLNKLIKDTEFCKDIRPTHKVTNKVQTDKGTVESIETIDSLGKFYSDLQDLEDKLQTAIREFGTVETEPVNETENTIETTTGDKGENEDKDETTVISWTKVFDFRSNASKVESLDLTNAALLHFSDYRQSIRAQQILLSFRPNAMIAKIAPGVDDMIWANVKLSEKQRWISAFKSNCYYWIFVIMFAPISTAIVALVDLRAIGKWYTPVETFRQNHPFFKEILQGFVAPFLAVLISKQAGIWIAAIMAIRNPLSKSEHALKTQGAHLFNLFFQIILIGAIFSNLYEFTTSAIINTSEFGILNHFRDNIPKKAHFFFNYTILDIFKELMLQLLNPKTLILERSFLKESQRRLKTSRALLEYDAIAPEFGLSPVWSRFLILPYFIFMTYAIIAPLIVIPSIVYFSLAYVIFKHRLINISRVNIETGGLFWRQCTKQFIYGLFLAQFSVLIQYSQFKKGLTQSFLIALLICFTFAFLTFIETHFGRIFDSLSIMDEDIQKSQAIVQKVLDGKNEVIQGAVEYLEDSAIVKSRLESDLRDHYNFTDIDPFVTEDKKISKKFDSFQEESEESSSKSFINPYWSIIPLNFNNAADDSGTFDPLQVDKLVDTGYVTNQYEYPLILKHTQILVIPIELIPLLQKQANK